MNNKKFWYGFVICASLIGLAAQYGNIDCLGLLKVGTISKLDTGTAVYLESVYFNGGQIGAPADKPTIYGTVLGLTANRTLITNGFGALSESTTTDTEIGYVAGVTSAIQTQLDAKSTKLTANATVNFTYDMTASQMQALINAQPKNLGGHTLTFQFGDGTYNTSMTSALAFQYFYNGNLNIYGNTGEADASALHTSQSVYLDFSAGTSSGIFLADCCCNILIRNLKIKISDTANIYGIGVHRLPASSISYNYIVGAAKTTSNSGILCLQSTMITTLNYISNVQAGIRTRYNSVLYSNTNADTGTAPNYGLYAVEGSTIGKNSTQPTGTTANEYASQGGVIR